MCAVSSYLFLYFSNMKHAAAMMLTTHFRDVRKAPGNCEYGLIGSAMCLPAHMQSLPQRIATLPRSAARRRRISLRSLTRRDLAGHVADG